MSRTVVVKIGGALVGDARALDALASFAGGTSAHVVIVHGGGPVVDRRLAEVGSSSEKIDGLRVTSDADMGVVAGALGGEVNGGLVAELTRRGVRAVGLTLGDWGVLAVERHENGALGCVGRVSGTEDDGELLSVLTREGVVPVLASIGSTGGVLLNVNADDAAAGVAAGVGSELLVLVSDVEAVLDDRGGAIGSLDEARAGGLVEAGVIRGGMVAKVRAALRASAGAGCPVVIGGAGVLESLAGGGEIEALGGTVVRASGALVEGGVE